MGGILIVLGVVVYVVVLLVWVLKCSMLFGVMEFV